MSALEAQPAAEAEAADAPPVSKLEASLRDARVSLRQDLDVTRHVFRGVVHYVLQDPLTFSSHSFSVEDYSILSRLTVESTLEETLDKLIESELVAAEDRELFYQFVFSMHRIGFLKLPVSDGDTLYKRFQARAEAKKKGRVSSFLFMPVPLWNPDQFLSRTMPHVRHLCSTRAFKIWMAIVAFATVVLIQSWSEFQRPVADIFSGENLPLLWLTLIGLKVIHEFGHAYACKYFGGHVPEMGVMLILFTPCAFVDASSSWTFKKKSERLMVCMAGMYVELFIAALALLAWSVTPPGILRECLHNIVLLASLVTVGFNVNPLMRYDGYYALTDLVEVPNLRSRSTDYATAVLKKWTLGVPVANRPDTSTMRMGLLTFGIASAVYKVVLVLGISVAIAFKFFLGGMLIGAFYFGGELIKIVKRLIPYLWHSEETATKRLQARFYGLLIVAGLPLGLMAIPVPNNIRSPGVVVGGKELIVRAEAAGFLADVFIEPGQQIKADFELMRLREPDKRANLAMTEAELDGAVLREQVMRGSDPALAAEELQRVEHLRERLDYNRKDLARLSIGGTPGGLVLSSLPTHEIGRYVKRGEEVATISRGIPVVRALLTEEDVAATLPSAGDEVQFRSYDDPTKVYNGFIRRISPTGSRELHRDIMEHVDLAEFALNPTTNKASRSQFELEVSLEPDAWLHLKHGMTGRVRIVGEAETLARVWYRKLITLLNRLSG